MDHEPPTEFERGRLAGIAEEHVRGLTLEIRSLQDGQERILKKLEELENWRWFVVGISSAVAFIISSIAAFFRH